jgi:hypothetical protein
VQAAMQKIFTCAIPIKRTYQDGGCNSMIADRRISIVDKKAIIWPDRFFINRLALLTVYLHLHIV